MLPAPSPTAGSSRWALALGIALVVPAVALFTMQAVVAQHDVFASDLLHAQLPYRAFLGEALREGRLPLWMPDIFSGVPFLAQIEAGTLFPPHMALFAAFEPFLALNLAQILDVLLAGGGVWFLARQHGASPAAAALGGLSFAWCGFQVSHFRHPNMHAAAALLPCLLFLTERLLAAAGRRGAPAVALCMGLLVAAGHPQVVYMAGLLLAARLVVFVVARPGPAAVSSTLRERVGTAVIAGSALALGAALLAVQLVPTWALNQGSLATVAPTWAFASEFPFRWADLLSFIAPAAVGAMETYDYAGAGSLPWENYGYVGIAPLLLAGLGAVRGRTGSRFWAGVVVVALLLTLGAATPLYGALWQWLPGMKLFRFPSRFLLLVGLGLAVLAAHGVDALLGAASVRARARLAWLLPAAILGATALDLQANHAPRLPLWDVAALKRADRGSILNDHQPVRVAVLDEFTLWEKAYRAARTADPPDGPFLAAWPLPIGSSGVLRGTWSPSGYARMVPWRTAAFWQGYNFELLPQRFAVRMPTAERPELSPAARSLLARASVGTLVSTFPVAATGFGQAVTGNVHVYANRDALPRAYVASTWRGVDGPRAAAEWMFREGVEELDVPAIEGVVSGSALSVAPAPVVELLAVTPEQLRLDVTGGPDGWLVLADSFDEGWSARVDGELTTIHVANGWQMAVRLPPGARAVSFDYWPSGLDAGLKISGVSLLLLLAWAASERSRRTT